MEVRNNWCNAGECRRGLTGGSVGVGGGEVCARGAKVGPLQWFAVGEHQSRAHLAAISAFGLQWELISREEEGHDLALQPCIPQTVLCSGIIHSHY